MAKNKDRSGREPKKPKREQINAPGLPSKRIKKQAHVERKPQLPRSGRMKMPADYEVG